LSSGVYTFLLPVSAHLDDVMEWNVGDIVTECRGLRDVV